MEIIENGLNHIFNENFENAYTLYLKAFAILDSPNIPMMIQDPSVCLIFSHNSALCCQKYNDLDWVI